VACAAAAVSLGRLRGCGFIRAGAPNDPNYVEDEDSGAGIKICTKGEYHTEAGENSTTHFKKEYRENIDWHRFLTINGKNRTKILDQDTPSDYDYYDAHEGEAYYANETDIHGSSHLMVDGDYDEVILGRGGWVGLGARYIGESAPLLSSTGKHIIAENHTLHARFKNMTKAEENTIVAGTNSLFTILNSSFSLSFSNTYQFDWGLVGWVLKMFGKKQHLGAHEARTFIEEMGAWAEKTHGTGMELSTKGSEFRSAIESTQSTLQEMKTCLQKNGLYLEKSDT